MIIEDIIGKIPLAIYSAFKVDKSNNIIYDPKYGIYIAFADDEVWHLQISFANEGKRWFDKASGGSMYGAQNILYEEIIGVSILGFENKIAYVQLEIKSKKGTFFFNCNYQDPKNPDKAGYEINIEPTICDNDTLAWLSKNFYYTEVLS